MQFRYWYVFVVILLIVSTCVNQTTADLEAGKMQSIITTADAVLQWQLENPSSVYWETSWLSATLYSGAIEFYRATGQSEFLEAVYTWAAGNNWQIGKEKLNANHQAVGQVYMTLFEIYGEDEMIEDISNALDSVVAKSRPGREVWWWCDALFMAPPALAQLADIKHSEKYLVELDDKWTDVYDYLYSEEDSLYYRDDRFFDRANENGNPIFWSRGNGWVMAGTVRVLQHLDRGTARYRLYVQVFQAMAEKIVRLQREDGSWSPSLLDPELYPYPESSGTGFYCYALAWGVNNGILAKSDYAAPIEDAWNALVKNVSGSGQLGWVQPPAATPTPAVQSDTFEYGTGAFLLAASELYRYYER